MCIVPGAGHLTNAEQPEFFNRKLEIFLRQHFPAEGTKAAKASWKIMEKSWSDFAMPLYPMRTMIPVCAALLLLQGFAIFVRSIMIVSTGKNYESRFKKEEIPTCVVPSLKAEFEKNKKENEK